MSVSSMWPKGPLVLFETPKHLCKTSRCNFSASTYGGPNHVKFAELGRSFTNPVISL